MKSKTWLIIEFLIIFVLLPVSFIFEYSFYLKAVISVVGFAYIIWILKTKEGIDFKIKKSIPWSKIWKPFLITFLCIIIATTAFVYLTDKSLLFYVPRKHPIAVFAIFGLYTLLSAWPQEILFRTFFYKRYSILFRNKKLLILINATIFMLAHLFFKNYWVLLMTFIGGILFSLTYLKYKSTTVVTIEHAIYGNWIFAVGMGQMLDFPGFDN